MATVVNTPLGPIVVASSPATGARSAVQSAPTSVVSRALSSSSSLRSSLVGSTATIPRPSAPPVAASEPATGYPEPKEEGISPVAIAAGVVGLGLVAFVGYQLTKKRKRK